MNRPGPHRGQHPRPASDRAVDRSGAPAAPAEAGQPRLQQPPGGRRRRPARRHECGVAVLTGSRLRPPHRTASGGRWQGGWHAAQRQPRGASPASHHQRRPPQRQRSPGRGMSSAADHDGGRAQRAASTVWRASGRVGSNPAAANSATMCGAVALRRPSGRTSTNHPSGSARARPRRRARRAGPRRSRPTRLRGPPCALGQATLPPPRGVGHRGARACRPRSAPPPPLEASSAVRASAAPAPPGRPELSWPREGPPPARRQGRPARRRRRGTAVAAAGPPGPRRRRSCRNLWAPSGAAAAAIPAFPAFPPGRGNAGKGGNGAAPPLLPAAAIPARGHDPPPGPAATR